MITAVRLAGALVIAGSVVASGQVPVPQTAPPPTGLLVGQTLDFTTGKAVGGAVVSLALGAGGGGAPGSPGANAALRFPMRVVTDGDGHFLFTDLPRGTYSLSASKPGYGATVFGRQSPSDTTTSTLSLADGERRGDVSLIMWKLASITGTVVDDAGEPVVGLPMRLMHRTIIGGRPRFTDVANAATDDRGMYREGLLPPGDYVVGVVTTETTVSLAWQSATTASMRGDNQAVNRDLGRSAIPMMGALGLGQRVGPLSMSSGSGLDLAFPPVVGDKVFVYPTMFYPTALTPSKATVITVSSGEERSGVDLQVRATATARVSGLLTGPTGPEGGVGLELINAVTDEADRDPVFAVAMAVSDATGAFTFLGVPVGDYLVRIQKNPLPPPEQGAGPASVIQAGSITFTTSSGSSLPPVTEDPTLWAQVPVSVTGADITGLDIVLRPGVHLSGRVQFNGARPQPTTAQLTAMNVAVQAAGGRTQAALTINGGTPYAARGSVDANGLFRTYQFPPGRYVVRVTVPPPGWIFAGATFRGHDVADGPLEVGGEDLTDIVLLMVDTPSELSGVVRATQAPDPTATVLIFPADPVQWLDYGPTARRLRLVHPSNDGSYRVSGLPAGDYLVTAIHSAVPSTWTDPEFLQRAAATGTRVTIADGDKKTQDLRSAEVRR